jgi:MFS family permease
LLSLYGGAVADRMDRRRLLLLSQPASLIVTLVGGLLIAAGWINLWLVVVLALAGSTVMSFDQPTRQALVPDLVPKHEVANAVTLNSMTMYLSMAIGPALAGPLIDRAGLAVTFYVIAATYLAVMLAVVLMRPVPRPAAGLARAMTAQIREGLSYVRREPVVLWLISCTFALMMLGMSFTNLAPVLIKEDLGSDAQGLGLTLTAWGIGAVITSVILTLGMRALRGAGALMLIMSGVFAGGLLVFAHSGSLGIAALSQFMCGVAFTVFMVVSNAAILSVTPAPVRGRVMGIYMMNRGLMPVGSLAAGALGGLLGVRPGIALLGLSSFAAVVLVTLLQPGAWRRVDAAIGFGLAKLPEPTGAEPLPVPVALRT